MKCITKFKEKLLFKLKNWDVDRQLKDLSIKLSNGNAVALLSPMRVFELVCFKVYQKGMSNFRIYGVSIDTHAENDTEVSITIVTRYPGYLIGKHGKLIDTFQAECQKVFGRHVVINLEEIRSDTNEPIIF